MKRKLVIIISTALALALAGMGVVLVAKPSRTAAKETQGIGVDVDAQADLRGQMAQLARHARTLENRLSRAEGAVAQRLDSEGRATQPASKAVKMTPEEREEYDQRLIETASVVMEESLAASVSDSGWTREVQSSLMESLKKLELPDQVTSVDCKQTMCRVTVQHANAGAWKAFRNNALTQAPFRGDMFFRYDPETRETSIYVAKPGSRLPSVRDAM